VFSPGRITPVVATILVLVCTSMALGKASHKGWPQIALAG